MARCKDCIHFDVCMDYTSLKDSKFAQNFNETDILCDHFKRAADVADAEKERVKAMPKIVGVDYENGKRTAVYVESEDGRQKFVAVRRGEWNIISGDIGYIEVQCSNCGHIEVLEDEEELRKYCPNCGARMDGKGEDHDI